MFVGVSVIEILLFNRKKKKQKKKKQKQKKMKNKFKLHVLYLYYKLFLIFLNIISFQHVFHLGVGRSQIEWKLKAKTQIPKIGQNDHSNPYIESTTVLSDTFCTVINNSGMVYMHSK